jgi:hypothetical protein
MKQINVNVQGDHGTDVPYIEDDRPKQIAGVFENPSRIIFHLPSDFNGGGHLVWTGNKVNFLIPPDGFVGEGSQLGLPDITYGPTSAGRWVVSGSQFTVNGAPIKWKGITHMRLLDLALDGVSIADHLTQVQEAGFNLVRVLGMKTNNTGWELSPYEPGYWDVADDLYTMCKTRGLQVEFTAFADTKYVMSGADLQHHYWENICSLAQVHDNVLLEFMNEYGHPTQAINPLNFAKPLGVTSSHGSGLTDADGVKPYWDYMTYHARRDAPPDARGFTNYDQYEFQAVYPSLPRVPDEGIKPDQYGFDTGYASLLGAHAALGAGGTFHWGGGVNSDMMDSPTFDCASAFCSAIK